MSAARTRPHARRIGDFAERRRVPLSRVRHAEHFLWQGRRWMMIVRGEERMAAVYMTIGTSSKSTPTGRTRVTVSKRSA